MLTRSQRYFALALLFVLGLSLAWILYVGSPPVYDLSAPSQSKTLRALVLNMTWKAALLDAALSALLLLTLPWWTREHRHPAGLKEEPRLPADSEITRPPFTRKSLLILLGFLALASAFRIPRLHLSFYNDEAHNFARYLCGSWKEKGSQLELRPARTFETLWLNSSGNNSQPHSLLSAACYSLWLKATGSPRGEVKEWPVRLPAFLAGLAALTVLGTLAHRWSGDKGMITLLAVGALHPWLVRYSSEARGYSLMILGVSLILLGLDKALSDGRWRSWFLLAAGVFLSAWSFVGTVYFLFTLYTCVMLGQLWCFWKHGLCMSQVLRPIIVGLFAVMLAAPLLLPSLPQLERVLTTFTSIQGDMNWSWWKNVGSYLLIGCPTSSEPGNPLMLSWQSYQQSSPFIAVTLWLLALFTLYGMYLLWLRRGAARLTLISAILGVLVAWSFMSLRGHYLHLWYVLYALPAIILALAAAMRRVPYSSLIVLFFYTLVSASYTTRSRMDERSAAVTALGGVWPHGNAEATLATLWTNTPIYHPATKILTRSEDLEPLIQHAQQTQRPLYVSMSHRGSALTTHAAAVARLEGPEFQKIATYWGQDEAQFTSYLFHYRQLPK